MDNSGYVKVHRKLFDSDIFIKKPCEWFKIWIFVLGSVNFADHGSIKEGSTFMKYDYIAMKCGVTYKQVEKCIGWLKNEGMICVERLPNGGIISVANWSAYQGENICIEGNQKGIKRESKGNAINKNARKKEEKNIYIDISDKDSKDVYPYFLYCFLDLGWEPGESDTVDNMKEWMRETLKSGGINSASDAIAVLKEFHAYWITRKDEKGFSKKNWKLSLLNSPSLPNNKPKYAKK